MIYILTISVLLLIIMLLILYIKELNFRYDITYKINKKQEEMINIYDKIIANDDKIINSQELYIDYLKKMKNRKDN